MYLISVVSSQMYKKDLYNMEEPVRINHGMKQSMSYSHQPPYQDKQPYREYDHPPYGYDGGGYAEPKAHNADPHPHYDNRVPHYNDQWPPYDQQTSSSQPTGYQPGHQQPLGYTPRSPYEDGPGRDYSPPQPRYDEASPVGYDGRPRHSKPALARYDEAPPPPPAGYDPRSPYEAEPHGFPINSPRSPEPPKQYYGEPGLRPAYVAGPPNRAYKPGMRETMMNSDTTSSPPKPDTLSSPGEPAVTPVSKPFPPPPRDDLDEDPAMKPQSVLNRVKMFENKRSVSMDRAKEGESSALRVRTETKQTSPRLLLLNVSCNVSSQGPDICVLRDVFFAFSACRCSQACDCAWTRPESQFPQQPGAGEVHLQVHSPH